MGVENKFSKTAPSDIRVLFMGDVQFAVPLFQRNYDWTKEHVETLWNDLIDNFWTNKNKESSQKEEYLLGPIVLVSTNEENKYLIIDGQQRLSTLTMLFCVARDCIIDKGINEGNEMVILYHNILEMIRTTDPKNKTRWKVTLNDTDRELFRQIQYRLKPDNKESKLNRITKTMGEAKSHKRLVDNYRLLYKRMEKAMRTNFDYRQNLTGATKPAPGNEKKNLGKKNNALLREFLMHIMEKNFVIKIIVDDYSTAYQIFETLNYRGRQLSKSNLIKNHVLSKIDGLEEQRSWSNIWNNIFDEIIKQDENDDVFIWESFRSRNHTRKNAFKKNLYSLVKRSINTEEEARQYVRTLKEDAGILTHMYNPHGYPNKITRNDFHAIKALNAKNIRVPILAAYRKWYDEAKRKSDYTKLVSFLVKYFFYRKIIQKTHARNIEAKMLEVVGLIEDGISLQNIIKNLQKDYNHDRFEQDFNTFATDPADAAAKYVLRQITVHLAGINSDVEPIDSLTLEHILPKSTSKWNREAFFGYEKTDEKIDDYVNRLGNLTLLNDKVNTEIKDNQFSQKKEKYLKSDLKINEKTVCNQSEWSAQVIDSRTSILTEYASKIWNLDGVHHTQPE